MRIYYQSPTCLMASILFLKSAREAFMLVIMEPMLPTMVAKISTPSRKSIVTKRYSESCAANHKRGLWSRDPLSTNHSPPAPAAASRRWWWGWGWTSRSCRCTGSWRSRCPANIQCKIAEIDILQLSISPLPSKPICHFQILSSNLLWRRSRHSSELLSESEAQPAKCIFTWKCRYTVLSIAYLPQLWNRYCLPVKFWKHLVNWFLFLYVQRIL